MNRKANILQNSQTLPPDAFQWKPAMNGSDYLLLLELMLAEILTNNALLKVERATSNNKTIMARMLAMPFWQ